MIDINLREQDPIDAREAWRDQRALDLCLFRLAEALDAQGFADDRVQEKKWLLHRVIGGRVYDDPPGNT
jgi:hypothetical protein